VPEPEQQFSITHARADTWRVLVLHGEIDLDTAPRLITAFTRAAGRREPLAIDLCDAHARDATHTALLVNAVRWLHQRRRDVVIVCPPGPARTALEQTAVALHLVLLEDARELYGRDIEPDRRRLETIAHSDRVQRGSTAPRRAALLAEATLTLEARHADPDLELDNVARAVMTSRRQLQRVFAEHTGAAFREELVAVRVQHAAVLLQTTELTVADIADRVGYRQAAHFANAFRRQYGMTPTGLRRARRNEGAAASAKNPPGPPR